MGYEQFGDYLEKQKESFSIKFDEIEEIIGQKLPNSAYQYDEWWSNSDSHPLMKVVLSKNWKTRKLNLSLKEIKFHKTSEFESEFEKIKHVCIEEFPKSTRNYREVTIKTLLESPGFTADQATILENIDELTFGQGHGTAIEMIREYLDIKFNILKKNGSTYSLLLSPNTSSEQVNELLKICGQAIAKYHIKKIVKDSHEVYVILPGTLENGYKYLNDFLKLNCIGAGWNQIKDLSKHPTKDAALKYIRNNHPDDTNQSATPIKFDIKKKDIVVLSKGQKEIIDFGIVTGDYNYNTDAEPHKECAHTRNVVWLRRGNIKKEDYSNEDMMNGVYSTVNHIDKYKQEMIDLLLEEEKQEYFLLRYNGKDRDSPVEEQWKQDKLGERYHFGKTVGNQKKLRKAGVGTKTIWFKTKNLPTRYFWGYGSVKEVKTIQEDKEWNVVYDDFKYFEEHEDSVQEEGVFLKRENESIKQQIDNLPGFSSQMSMLKITKKIYEEITGDRSTMSALTTQQNLDKFVRALNWKPNLILYGPPGTGKTWQAKRIAKLITKNQNNSSDSEYSLSRYGKKLDDILDIKKHTWKMIATKILLENNGTAINYHDMSKLATEYRDTSGLTPHETIAKDIRDDIEKFGDDSFFTHPSDGMYGLKTPTTFAKAAEMILFAENKPMHFNEINKIALDKHIVSTEGVTPEKSLLAEITKSIQADGDKSKFLRVDDGIYVLRSLVKNINLKNFSSYIKRVTFHQSFSYEEFIEGIKVNPTEDSTGVTYDVEPGIFQEFCIHAQKDDKNNYVMIIDEINRGNIAKIFGELITIIENDKRGEPVTLAYSKKEFNVPENVFIIGTMNTADQSLTHLDAALKRRFTMIEIPPDSNVLEHSKVEGVDLTNLLDAINKKLVEHKFRDRRIGHSYFMSKDENSGQTGSITKIEDLQMAFATDIIPVLRDHFYDQEDILKDILGNEFLDWENDQDLKEDWQEDKEIFKEILKKAFGV